MILPLCLPSFPHLYLGCWEQPLLNFAGLYFVSLSENQIPSSIHCWIPFPYDLAAINLVVKNRFSDTPMPQKNQKNIAYFLPIGWLKKWICIYTSIHYITLHYFTWQIHIIYMTCQKKKHPRRWCLPKFHHAFPRQVGVVTWAPWWPWWPWPTTLGPPAWPAAAAAPAAAGRIQRKAGAMPGAAGAHGEKVAKVTWQVKLWMEKAVVNGCEWMLMNVNGLICVLMDEYVCLLGCFLGLKIITRITVVSGTKWMFLPQLR